VATSKSELKFPDSKISDTFLQFAEPLLKAFGPDVTEAQMEQPLMIAWTVWNAVVYAGAGENGEMLEGVRTSMGRDPQLRGRQSRSLDDSLITQLDLFATQVNRCFVAVSLEAKRVVFLDRARGLGVEQLVGVLGGREEPNPR
jgi:hypothetical protein